MKLVVVAVGMRMPDWAQTACDDFAKRLPADWHFQVKTVKAETRGSKAVPAMQAAEAERIEAAIATACGKAAHVVALDEHGKSHTTASLAQRLKAWQLDATNTALVIGGPDGLCPQFKAKASEALRLSDMTLPHALARVVLIEQLYRAWSVNANHPYHRD